MCAEVTADTMTSPKSPKNKKEETPTRPDIEHIILLLEDSFSFIPFESLFSGWFHATSISRDFHFGSILERIKKAESSLNTVTAADAATKKKEKTAIPEDTSIPMAKGLYRKFYILHFYKDYKGIFYI